MHCFSSISAFLLLASIDPSFASPVLGNTKPGSNSLESTPGPYKFKPAPPYKFELAPVWKKARGIDAREAQAGSGEGSLENTPGRYKFEPAPVWPGSPSPDTKGPVVQKPKAPFPSTTLTEVPNAPNQFICNVEKTKTSLLLTIDPTKPLPADAFKAFVDGATGAATSHPLDQLLSVTNDDPFQFGVDGIVGHGKSAEGQHLSWRVVANVATGLKECLAGKGTFDEVTWAAYDGETGLAGNGDIVGGS